MPREQTTAVAFSSQAGAGGVVGGVVCRERGAALKSSNGPLRTCCKEKFWTHNKSAKRQCHSLTDPTPELHSAAPCAQMSHIINTRFLSSPPPPTPTLFNDLTPDKRIGEYNAHDTMSEPAEKKQKTEVPARCGREEERQTTSPFLPHPPTPPHIPHPLKGA